MSTSLAECFDTEDAPSALQALRHRGLWSGVCSLYLPPIFTLFNTHLRLSKLKRYVKALGLTSARAQSHTFDTIAGPIAELRDMYPNAGAIELRTNLLNKFDMRVSK